MAGTRIFDKPYARFMAACARLKNKDVGTLRTLAKSHPTRVTTRVGPATSQELWILLGSKEAGASHVHIDVASAEYGASAEGAVIAPDAFLNKLDPFFGQEVKVHLTGRFQVPWDELPNNGLVRATLLESTSDGLVVRQTAATIILGENTKQKVTLSFFRYKDLLRTEILVVVETKIDGTYLNRLHNLLSSIFSELLVEYDDANPKGKKRGRVGAKIRKHGRLGGRD